MEHDQGSVPSSVAQSPAGAETRKMEGDVHTSGAPLIAPRNNCATDPEPLRNLIVNYLPPMMDESQLYQLFAQFGPIESVKIIYDKETKESRGYGFVKYVYFPSASHAMNLLNGYHIAGKRLKVAFANAEAAMESFKAMRETAVMFSYHQQLAMQNIFYHQMLLVQQQQQDAA
ncbi:putative RNA recognition motif (a k a RRM RBD or RNP domain) [Trypanosoma vivax]|uniref:Putative RNA-binding protein n=1 Tax=Trypanosoma vivax (strain Y486) TaxID=1055687 RepID=G0U9R9_TRYVY|nr:putative RNA-binding protein [Trypanosoma vivax]KAH8619062.1 putative RNA recognition motif (a k a RRM RBD or RNP domain) [Trypanosoma vivax]CCC52550.1 putative RNA-binding protein [Trypanosoma vivax Y486]